MGVVRDRCTGVSQFYPGCRRCGYEETEIYHLEQTRLRELKAKLTKLVRLHQRWSQMDAAQSLDDLRAQRDLVNLAILALEALMGVEHRS